MENTERLPIFIYREEMMYSRWENFMHFGNFSGPDWEKKILFCFGNDTGNRSRFDRGKNH